jgi:hypothetical protein
MNRRDVITLLTGTAAARISGMISVASYVVGLADGAKMSQK